MEIKGRDLIEGIPKTLTITDAEIREALAEPISIIVNAVRVALERTPPELSADIVDRGIVLTGGGSLLKNLDKLLREETRLPVSVAEDPLSLGGAGHGEDALGLRPAAQDQPGLDGATAGRRRSAADSTGPRSSRSVAASCSGGSCSPTSSLISRQVERAGGTSLLGQAVFAVLSPAAAHGRGGAGRGAGHLVGVRRPARTSSARTRTCADGWPPSRWRCSGSRTAAGGGAPAGDRRRQARSAPRHAGGAGDRRGRRALVPHGDHQPRDAPTAWP